MERRSKIIPNYKRKENMEREDGEEVLNVPHSHINSLLLFVGIDACLSVSYVNNESALVPSLHNQ